jgi:hypothetical protein
MTHLSTFILTEDKAIFDIILDTYVQKNMNYRTNHTGPVTKFSLLQNRPTYKDMAQTRAAIIA